MAALKIWVVLAFDFTGFYRILKFNQCDGNIFYKPINIQVRNMKAQRFEMQWDEETRLLAERAATLSGHTSLKAYVTQLIREDAPKVLSNYEHLKVTNENFDRFMAACQNPPKPSNKLLKATKALAQEGIWVETKI